MTTYAAPERLRSARPASPPPSVIADFELALERTEMRPGVRPYSTPPFSHLWRAVAVVAVIVDLVADALLHEREEIRGR
jgi:hypothetical protein